MALSRPWSGRVAPPRALARTRGPLEVIRRGYTRADGSTVTGPSLSSLVAEADPAVDAELKTDLDATVAALDELVSAAEGGMAYDMMLAPGNSEGEALITAAVDGLVKQTQAIERAVTALGVSGLAFEGSDSLDNPTAVFQ